jgi:hypothetical protein
MASLDFPNSPTLDQVFESGDGRAWTWTGTTWDAVLVESPAGPQGETGPTGAEGPEGPAGADGADGVDGSFSSTQTVENGSTRALTSADAGKLITNTGAITITVQGLSAGQQVDFLQTNTAQITFTPGSGITLNSKSDNRKTAAQYSPASVKCVASNSYVLVGDLVA